MVFRVFSLFVGELLIPSQRLPPPSRIMTTANKCTFLFPECVAKGSCLTWESEGRAVFAGRCFPVRNRPQPSSTVLNCSNPSPMALPLGRARKSDF